MACPEVHSSTAAAAGSRGRGGGNRVVMRKKKPGPGPGVQIREVWADNVEREFKLIRAAMPHLPYVSMDTEFPGVIHHPHPGKHPAALTPAERYALVKANVDALHLIQVGLTFAASPASPPALAFQINLCDFDPRAHRHAPDSLRLLADSGVDFAANRARGVPATTFAALMMSSGLVCRRSNHITWVAFSSAYDFAYLIKLLMGRKLPRSMPDFLRYVRVFFGEHLYDVKHVMAHCAGLYGGLDRVAATLGVQRAAGRSHQAGSDSLLTWDTFRRINQLYFPHKAKELHSFAGVLFGLELLPQAAHHQKNTVASSTGSRVAAAPQPQPQPHIPACVVVAPSN